MAAIYSIVEGHGEVRAVPVLLRRIAQEFCGIYDLDILDPHRVPRGRMLSDNSEDLKKAIELGKRRISSKDVPGFILVLLDADDDCPVTLAQSIFGRIKRDDITIIVVIANKEYESWFLKAIKSLRGTRGISDIAEPPDDSESIRDAKGYLERNYFGDNEFYQETVDQARLTSIFDINEARLSSSFDKFYREIYGNLMAD
ncbi:MAG: DUF4276 family protein [Alphaproteobacteria bacterium]